MLLVDVTTYNNVSQEWLPVMMDKGLFGFQDKIEMRNEGFNQMFYVTHSRKKLDRSKVAWRLILK